MKKILYTTTALVAATVISSAAMADMGASSRSGSSMKSMKMNSASQLQSARYMQENDMMGASAFKATVGGYANWYMGYADQDAANVNEFDVMGDAEIHFNFEAALKNGMKIGVHTALETDTATEFNSATIEQTYMYVESMYGKVIAGRHNNVNEQLSVHSIDVGALDIQETDFSRFVISDGATISTYFAEDQELTKLSYITPKFHGFQAGMTYAPANSSDITNENVTRDSHDSTIVTAVYETTIQNVGFAVSAGYGFATDLSDHAAGEGYSIDQWNIGGRLIYEGFSLTGAYKSAEYGNFDITIWDAGIAYEMGPYATSLSYISADNNTYTFSTMLLSGRYSMAAGVDAFATVGYGNDESYQNASFKTVGNKGWAVITGMMLSF